MTRGICTARSHALYVLILACIARKPMTAPEIADEVKIGRCSVWPVLRRLRGIAAHVCEYQQFGKNRAAVWAFGLGAEPSPPPGTARATVPKMRAELTAFANAAEMLTREPVSVRQLHEETGISRGTIYLILRLAKKNGIAHIAEWDRERRNGPYVAHWMFAAGKKDAVKPRLMSRREIDTRNWRGRSERIKQQRLMAALSANSPHLKAAA